MTSPLLAVEGLHTCFVTPTGPLQALEGISLHLQPGETLALLGESGCGKSVTALSLMGLLPRRSAYVSAGRILFQGQDLLSLSDRQLRAVRGARLSMVFQDPMSALNPVLTIGRQVAEPLRRHLGLSARQARQRAIELLAEVGIVDPQRRVDAYPHELSGGMCQRVVIAMAIACDPLLLVADEPTTALDVTVQRQILQLLKRLQRERGLALLLITHDLGVVQECADRVMVMYLGQVVESATTEQLFRAPAHPYSRGLLASMPDIGRSQAVLPSIPGSVPDLRNKPVGCRFAPRCALAESQCRQHLPQLEHLGPRTVRCWKPLVDAMGVSV